MNAGLTRTPHTDRLISLDVLRIIAILGVIAIHVFGAIVLNNDIRGSTDWWAATAVNKGSIWVIPVFVMVSGSLLLAPGAHRNGPASFYRKRLLRLGPAFIFWQLFYVFVVRIALSGQDLSIGRIVQLFADGNPYTHLYFLWLIVGLYAVAPVLAAFVNQGGRKRAFWFAGLVLAVTLLVYAYANFSALHGSPRPVTLNALTQWLPYVGFFLTGWALRGVVLTRLWTVVVGVITFALLGELVWQYGVAPQHVTLQAIFPVSYLGSVAAAAAIGVFLVVKSAMSRMRVSERAAAVLRKLSLASFGTFLIHFVFIVLARKLFPALVDPMASSFVVAGAAWLIITCLSFASSLAALRVPYLRRIF